MSKKQKNKTVADNLLLDILSCPDCKSDVGMVKAKIVCKKCGKKYSIVNGIPVMLIAEADK
jgi:uncharacterized protein YbaR (Trm112 family)